MKTVLLFSIVAGLTFGFTNSFGQKNQLEPSLKQLPANWKLTEKNPSSYLVTTTHYDYSMMGPFIQKTQITGEYTRGLKNGYVKWNKVEIAASNNREMPFETGEVQSVMENFTYLPNENMMAEETYKDFPQTPNVFMLKNLVWDMMAFESFAWSYSDSLALNIEFQPLQQGKIELAGQGTFENKEMKLTWIGITTKNQQTCAIIKYSVMNNPLTLDSDYLKMKGRSHYWGNIYVSLNTKQVEFAEMVEDVIMELKFGGQETPVMMNTVRTIFVERKNQVNTVQ